MQKQNHNNPFEQAIILLVTGAKQAEFFRSVSLDHYFEKAARTKKPGLLIGRSAINGNKALQIGS